MTVNHNLHATTTSSLHLPSSLSFCLPPHAMKALTLFLLLLLPCLCHAQPISPSYSSIFSFGDSFSDTGNFVIMESGILPNIPVFPPPYARCSNGRLIIDFLAEYFGLPLIPPSLSKKESNFTTGANFAVMGATALDLAFFQSNDISNIPPINSSMNVQLRWFEEMKPTLCGTPQACDDYFRKALFVFGEFGGNDYSFTLNSGKTVEYVKSLAPKVVDAIAGGIERLIEHGARHVVVPGNLPAGCVPILLTFYHSDNKEDYDPRTGCLKKLNSIALYHNAMLRMALGQLQSKHPEARIIYADYYSPVIQFARTPQLYGFTNGALRVCCGGGGPYNYNVSASCGLSGATQCKEPNTHVSWDGIHLTEAPYHFIANGWLKGPYAHPPILSVSREELY